MDYESLVKLAFNVHRDELTVVDREAKATSAKRALTIAKDDLGLAISRATRDAYAEGRITGKSAEIRAVELECLLAETVAVQDLRRAVREATFAVDDAEAEYGYVKAAYHFDKALLEAAMVASRDHEPPFVVVTSAEAPQPQSSSVEVQATPAAAKAPIGNADAALCCDCSDEVF